MRLNTIKERETKERKKVSKKKLTQPKFERKIEKFANFLLDKFYVYPSYFPAESEEV
jgi:hypothetical protein